MGYIHSLESFGTVDGPGVRFVVFFEGCPMRCQYCHNPDTWKIEDGEEMTADEIIDRFERNRSFYQTGGITATGGEPMLQLDISFTPLLRCITRFSMSMSLLRSPSTSPVLKPVFSIRIYAAAC